MSLSLEFLKLSPKKNGRSLSPNHPASLKRAFSVPLILRRSRKASTSTWSPFSGQVLAKTRGKNRSVTNMLSVQTLPPPRFVHIYRKKELG